MTDFIFDPPLFEGVIVRREVFLGESKLDFLVSDVFLEVKTPQQRLQLDAPNG